MAKNYFVGGNYKAAATVAVVTKIVDALNASGDLPSNVEVVVAPSALHVGLVMNKLRHDIKVAVQDIHTAKGLGAYTGASTADLVKDLGISWVLVGHSERRSIFGETDADSAAKTKVALEAGLSVILCVGESLAEREAGATLAVVTRQLQAVAAVLTAADWARIVIAYEPVWAIGTGKVASPAQAQDVHAEIRVWLAAAVGKEAAAAARVIYGGSVNAANCAVLAAEKDIDGFLVGGASLKPEFLDIIKATGGKAQ